MKRNSQPRTSRSEADAQEGGWLIDYVPGGIFLAKHKASGAIVTGHLFFDNDNGSSRLRVLEYRHLMDSGFVGDGPPAPIDIVEERVNQPGDFQIVVDLLFKPAVTGGVPPMLLPPEMVAAKRKPDAFYERVLAYVRLCEEHQIKPGPRLAKDNNVPAGTVRSWIHQARLREHLDLSAP